MTPRRIVALSLLAAGALAAGVGPCAAQAPPITLGGMGGWVRNSPVWDRGFEAEPVGGLLVGAWVDVPTPVARLSVTAEAALTQRGSGTVLDPAAVPEAFGTHPIRTDYLTTSVLPRATLRLGVVRLHATTGPTMDLLLRSRVDVILDARLEDAATAVFGWTLGVGIGTDRAGTRVFGIEARLFEGLGHAYSGDVGDLRNRSFEVLARVGVAR